MEAQQSPLASIWTHTASPNRRRSPISASSASNSVGNSSLDTASANGRLEHSDVPWSFSDMHGLYKGLTPRRSRSYAAFLEWSAMTPGTRRNFTNARPLAGASRQRMIDQIKQLTKDKAALQAQLAAINLSGHALIAPSLPDAASTKSPLATQIDGLEIVDDADEVEGDQLERLPIHGSPVAPLIDSLTGLPSTLVEADQTLENSPPTNLEHLVAHV